MFRDPALAQPIVRKIENLTPQDHVRFCHVCGTHEFTVTRFGLRALLPPSIEVIAGPGCPVCIVPAEEIDEAIWLAQHGVTVMTFGDMLRVPGTKMSLSDAKATGGDVRVVYSVTEAVKMARREPDRNFVFFAIGFETTTPTNAAEILRNPPKNLSFLVSHRLIPPAMELLLGIGDIRIDGFICPGHVATIIGADAFSIFPETYNMPTVVAGFEPIDVLMAILMLLKQLKDGARLDNEYARSVTKEGNVKAQRLIKEVFDVAEGRWRGIGRIPSSAYKLKDAFYEHDARLKYDIETGPARDIAPGCSCHLVIIGKINPPSCPMFLKACKPEHPLGPCMVSHEGTCNIWSRHAQL
ncbi:MAG: hydrogenase formation protein HypD [Methanocellales archaeon]|nr:hydrogenase formation protein HypD [Methanocellales archaeon]